MPIHLIICVDYGLDTVKYEDRFKIFSIEKEKKKRREWHHISEETFQGEFGERVKKFILALSETPPTGVGGFCRYKLSLVSFGQPIHHQTGV